MHSPETFLRFALSTGVLKFGEFKTKAGRMSPYFFNAGLFDTGDTLGQLAGFYADAILAARTRGVQFDMLFGPAYKGIPLAATTAMALAQKGLNLPFAYNRKEAKDHGEGGTVVGAPLKGKVAIIDDVISAGTSVRESIELIRAQGAEPAAVIIALDRMEKGGTADAPTATSAVQEVQQQWGLPVVAIASLNDLFALLQNESANEKGTESSETFAKYFPLVRAYREKYGV
jgi:orotate phosphoribosyltransferase